MLARRLAQTGSSTAATARGCSAALKPGQRLVSREGDLWRWDGYVADRRGAARRRRSGWRAATGSPRSPPKAEPARDRRRRNARAELEAAEAAVAARRRRPSARRARRCGSRGARSTQRARRSPTPSARRAGSRRGGASLEEALARLAADLAESEAAAERAARRPRRDRRRRQPRRTSSASSGRASSEDRAALAEARAAVESMAREAELRSGRLAAIAVERQNWHERATNAESQIATLTRAGRRGRRPRRSGSPTSRRRSRRSARRSSPRSPSPRRPAPRPPTSSPSARRRSPPPTRRRARRSTRCRRRASSAAAPRSAWSPRRSGSPKSAERIREALDCAPEEAAAVAELKPDAPLPDLDEIEARLERYRQERERLGAVNLRAEEEAREIGARRDALVGERDDLVAAIQRLRQGIGSLNREGRERLLAAFETVNAHFQRLFTHLFGGGTAELQLTESDDPLEAGLEIVARPPGKKPQIMTLLSGGEQALTALSLIFAVFLTNPAPICVLDEVDAPLDDANVERFCNLLDEMTRQTDTRFVVITHNPITMARMNRLFGVTMAERGVSQLVSVDLETAERFREAG